MLFYVTKFVIWQKMVSIVNTNHIAMGFKTKIHMLIEYVIYFYNN